MPFHYQTPDEQCQARGADVHGPPNATVSRACRQDPLAGVLAAIDILAGHYLARVASYLVIENGPCKPGRIVAVHDICYQGTLIFTDQY